MGLADPEEYDPKLKKWRYADLPIVPSKFKLVPNGPDTTMRKIVTGARDTLQACAQANIGGTASQSLVDRINSELDK